jgi:hypothetical protein
MLVLAGLLLIVAGVTAIFFDQIHLPFGHLPGDLSWRGRGWSVSFPLATCLVVSVVLSLMLWVVHRLRG